MINQVEDIGVYRIGNRISGAVCTTYGINDMPPHLSLCQVAAPDKMSPSDSRFASRQIEKLGYEDAWQTLTDAFGEKKALGVFQQVGISIEVV